jgi:hypothetical protein
MSLPIEQDAEKLRAWADEIRGYATTTGKSPNYALEVVLGRHNLSKFSKSPKVIERRPAVIKALRHMYEHGTLPPKEEPRELAASASEPVAKPAPAPTRVRSGSWIDGYYGNS